MGSREPPSLHRPDVPRRAPESHESRTGSLTGRGAIGQRQRRLDTGTGTCPRMVALVLRNVRCRRRRIGAGDLSPLRPGGTRPSRRPSSRAGAGWRSTGTSRLAVRRIAGTAPPRTLRAPGVTSESRRWLAAGVAASGTPPRSCGNVPTRCGGVSPAAGRGRVELPSVVHEEL